MNHRDDSDHAWRLPLADTTQPGWQCRYVEAVNARRFADVEADFSDAYARGYNDGCFDTGASVGADVGASVV